MIFKKFLVLTVLLSIYNLNASDNNQPVAEKYPFSDQDKALFYNPVTQKIESPYSTASVLSFPTNVFVKIEKDIFEKLLAHAKQRSHCVYATAHVNFNSCEENKQKEKFKNVMQEATMCSIKFDLYKFALLSAASNNIHITGISQQDLIHVLQWTNGIKTIGLTITGHEDDFWEEITLGENKILAPKSLKSFIAQNEVFYHKQDQTFQWFDDILA